MVENEIEVKRDNRSDHLRGESYGELFPFAVPKKSDPAPPWVRAFAPLIKGLWPVYLAAGLLMATLLLLQFGDAVLDFGNKGERIRNIGIIIAAAVGLPFLVWRTWNLQRQTNIAQESHYTDLFTKAVEQLGAGKRSKPFMVYDEEQGKDIPGEDQWGRKIVPSDEGLELRLGAIYALERIARESRKDHWPIMEVLCAFVRSNPVGAVDVPDIDDKAVSIDSNMLSFAREKLVSFIPLTPLDIQAAIDVIGRRTDLQLQWEEEDRGQDQARSLNLKGANLQLIEATGGQFAHANFSNTECQCADFRKADCQNSNFTNARCESTNFADAQCQRAVFFSSGCKGSFFHNANCNGAFFFLAKCSDAFFLGTLCKGTVFNAVDFSRAQSMTQSQINEAFGDHETVLPGDLAPPDFWPIPLSKLHPLKAALSGGNLSTPYTREKILALIPDFYG